MTWKSILKLYPDRNQIWNQSATLGKAVLFALAAWVVSFIAHADPAGTPRPDFAVGQMWSIKSAGPTTAKVVVGRIETWNGMTAIHVSLIDIPVPRDTEGRGKLITIDHVPFKGSALASSVDQLVAIEVEPPSGFERGYQSWRKDKNANVFDVSVPQVITLMLETIIRGRA
jgi:hypothetical protein